MDLEIVATLEVVDISYQLKIGSNYLIGRKTENSSKLDIELPNTSVDEKHAVIQISGGTVKILDLYSKSGTFLNGQRIDGLREVTITTTASILFGEVGAKLQFCAAENQSHDNSGFHDGQKNISDIIPSSTEFATAKCVASLRHVDENSVTSTPNIALSQKSLTNKCQTVASTFNISSQQNFLPPVSSLRKSSPTSITAQENLNISTSSFDSLLGDKSRDSFSIPETQQCQRQTARLSANSRNVNLSATESNINLNRRSKNQSNLENDDEFCIPETQEPAAAVSIKSQKLFVANQTVVDANLTQEIFNDSNITSGSQFRICTHDFNDDNGFGEVFDDSDSSDLLSLVIPCIKHKPVIINDSRSLLKNPDKVKGNGDVSQISILNCSEHNSKDSAINCEQSERDLACTPDLFDLPETAQANIMFNLNLSPNRKDTCALLGIETAKNLEIYPDKPSANPHALVNQSNAKDQTIFEPSLFEDEEDLMPTQVFSKVESNEKSAITTKCSPEYLTLSDKENMLPTATAVLELLSELQPTQLLPHCSHTSSNVNSDNDKNREFRSPSHVSDLPFEDSTKQIEEIENLLPPTQVFLVKKSTTDRNEEPSTSKHISSTLIPAKERAEKIALMITECFENTPKKSKDNEFLKPVGMLSKKSSTLSNVSSMSENSDIDMLMCTPQIIADNFNQPDLKTKTSLIEKHKSLFGDDSEDEEGDVLKLITTPKVSHDFDKLLPHLKKQVSPKRDQEEAKLHSYNRSFSSKDETKSKGKSKIAPSRDQRHTTRDKKREKSPEDLSKKNLKKVPKLLNDNAKRGTKRRQDVESNGTDNGSRPPKKNKEETVNVTIESSEKSSNSAKSSNKVQNKLKNAEFNCRNDSFEKSEKNKIEPVSEDRSSKKTLEQNIAMSSSATRATRARSHSQSTETEATEISSGRLTRLKSRTKDLKIFPKEIESREIESLSKKSEQKSDTKTITDKNYANVELMSNRKITRSCSRDTKDSFSTTDTERKRLRSTSSLGDVNTKKSSSVSSTSSKHNELRSKRLQVSMTMVDPELFQSLAKSSQGIWTIAEDPLVSDILIMDKGNRTFKFLVAMARGIPVVTSSWLESLNKAREITSMNKYFFKDESFEKRHKFSLIKTIELARKQKLFEEYSFLMTPNIKPQCDEMKVIIKCAGGMVLEDVPSQRDNQKLYLISSKDDQKLWHKYRRINNSIRIISSEGVMSSVMRQTVKPLETNLIG